jgi:hypothetical protein
VATYGIEHVDAFLADLSREAKDGTTTRIAMDKKLSNFYCFGLP